MQSDRTLVIPLLVEPNGRFVLVLMEVSAMLDADVRLTDDAPLVFAARFVAHDGPMGDAAADRLYEDFSGQQLR